MIENDWAHFGLNHSPFESDADNSFYFPIKSWEQRIELLLHLCQFSQAILVVTGEIGSGKSTFKNRLIACVAQTDPNRVKKAMSVCHLTGSMLLSPPHLYQSLQSTFGLTAGDSDDPCAQLFDQVRASGKRYLIVVDDAHLLPQDTLSLLLKMGSRGFDVDQGLHVLLIGRCVLSDHIAKVPVTDNADHLIHTTVLEPFTLMETKQYITACFQHAGFKGRLPIPDPEIAKIYRDSKGCPQDINQLTQRWLATVSSQRQVLSFRLNALSGKSKLAIVCAIGLIVAGGIWLSQSTPVSTKQPIVPVPIKPHHLAHNMAPKTPVLQKITLTPPIDDDTAKASNATEEKAKATSMRAKPVVPTPTLMAPTARSTPTHANTQVATAGQAAAKPVAPANPTQLSAGPSGVVQPAKPAPHRMSPAQADAILASINRDGGLHIDLSDADAAKPRKTMPATHTAPTRTTPASASTSIQHPAPSAAKQAPQPVASESVVFLHPKAKPAALTKPVATKPVAVVSKKPVSLSQMALIAHQHAISRLPASHYTLQLVGMHSIADAVTFIQKHQLSTARFIPVKSHGKVFYVVLLGDFASSASAKSHLSTMPAAIKALHPWVRSFHSVQQAMLTPGPIPDHNQVANRLF